MKVDARLSQLYDGWLAKTGDVQAAATLTLAQVQSTGDCTPQERPGAEYLTVKQAAAKYNLGERTVYRMVEQGLPAARVGKAIRIKPRDLAKHLADSETILR